MKDSELDKLRKRWQRKTGAPMPESIARLSIEQVRVAVQRTLAGEHVFVPSCQVTAKRVDEEIRDWDKDSNG